MDENKEQSQEQPQAAVPVMGEYQGKPVIRIPTVDNPSPDVPWHWFTFGKAKAKAVVKHFEAVKKFAES